MEVPPGAALKTMTIQATGGIPLCAIAHVFGQSDSAIPICTYY
ncbi:hypothetical protein [Cupriavidus sp. UYPR2.512]|nr:hypothetical protein [Cupriavidus sp. UYPR2.512]